MVSQVAIGRFGSPYGVKGWVKVISYTNPPENILEYAPWVVIKDNREIILDKIRGKLQGKTVIVQLESCQDRDAAKLYTNLEIYVDRSQLPESEADEYYWIDLIGLTVINKADETLGQVKQLLATGSNDVLIVKNAAGKERYIPYIADVIMDVDIPNKQITVDWDAEF